MNANAHGRERGGVRIGSATGRERRGEGRGGEGRGGGEDQELPERGGGGPEAHKYHL